MRMVSRGDNRQHPADRLDPIRAMLIVDEGDHGLCRRSSSAWAKYALALRRISLACRSSRFSRSSTLSLAAMSLVRPGFPLSRSAFFTHSFSVCAVQPILPAIDTIAAHRYACSSSLSSTIRTARERTSGENLFVGLLVIAPPPQELEPPTNPVQFTDALHSASRAIRSSRSGSVDEGI